MYWPLEQKKSETDPEASAVVKRQWAYGGFSASQGAPCG